MNLPTSKSLASSVPALRKLGARVGKAGWLSLLAGATLVGLLSLGPFAGRTVPGPVPAPVSVVPVAASIEKAAHHADFGAIAASEDARQLAGWVAATADNDGRPFILIDKKQARLYLFDASARLRESTAVLLGAALGDDTVPGIGTRPIADVRPEERTTPAGRFVGEQGRNAAGKDVVWVDYDAAVSMHRVVTTQPKERRLERLASPSIADKRISYGCINVPVAFFDAYIRPTFATQDAVIYVLPEQKSLQQVFGMPLAAAALGIMSMSLPAAGADATRLNRGNQSH